MIGPRANIADGGKCHDDADPVQNRLNSKQKAYGIQLSELFEADLIGEATQGQGGES